MKYLKTFLIICVLGLLYTSCAKKQNYSVIPVITFNSFEPFCNGSITDSAYLRINFTDGDGDIGYPASDASAPINCFILPMVYDNNKKAFDVITNSGDTLMFKYLIPYITPSGSDKELNGIIQINFEDFIQKNITTPLAPLLSSGIIYYELQFQVWIYDRAGHKSNVLTTPMRNSCH